MPLRNEYYELKCQTVRFWCLPIDLDLFRLVHLVEIVCLVEYYPPPFKMTVSTWIWHSGYSSLDMVEIARDDKKVDRYDVYIQVISVYVNVIIAYIERLLYGSYSTQQGSTFSLSLSLSSISGSYTMFKILLVSACSKYWRNGSSWGKL